MVWIGYMNALVASDDSIHGFRSPPQATTLGSINNPYMDAVALVVQSGSVNVATADVLGGNFARLSYGLYCRSCRYRRPCLRAHTSSNGS